MFGIRLLGTVVKMDLPRESTIVFVQQQQQYYY
jgi:hypothetical protein